MRIVVGSIIHESNTFSPMPTDLAAFREVELLFDEDLITQHTNRETEIGGMLHQAQQRGIEIIPTISAVALPAGSASKSKVWWYLGLARVRLSLVSRARCAGEH